MNRRMIWTIGITAVVFASLFFCRKAKAEEWKDLKWQIGPLSLNAPFQEVNAVYLRDLLRADNLNLLGGETPVAKLWNVRGNLGAVTSTNGKGSPFVSGHLELPNPLTTLVFLSDLRIGLAGGWDFESGKPLLALKASKSLW